MTNEAILDKDGNEVPEGILDGIFTVLCAMHDLKRDTDTNSVPVAFNVKPKCMALKKWPSLTVSGEVENYWACLNYLKMGIMDEERRDRQPEGLYWSSRKPRRVYQYRLPDRTGDEITRQCKPALRDRKAEMKAQPGLQLTKWNVDIGLECNLKIVPRSVRACGHA